MAPVNDRTVLYCFDDPFSIFCLFGVFYFLAHIQIIPENDGVLDKTFAVVGNVLFFCGSDLKLGVVTEKYRFGEFVGIFYLIELLFDPLSKLDIIDVG